MPAHREDTQDSGRPKGGIAQLSKKNIKVKHERISTKSYRIQAQVLHFPSTRLLWINAYFPTDPRTVRYNDEELIEVLNEVENILDTASFDDVLWAGDLNWDMGRQTGFSHTIRRFMERLGLTSVWEKHPVSYTHIHTDQKSTSTLDHFMVNERLLSVISDSGVLHLGDNLSRHSPIMLKLNLGALPSCPKSKPVKNTSRPAWYKASQEDKNLYTEELDRKLSSLGSPDSLTCSNPLCTNAEHSRERDSFVLDLMSTVIETSHATIPMSGPKHEDLSRSCPVWKSIPGWPEFVHPYREDAIFWHSVWQSAGRPDKGVLRDTMVRTKPSIIMQ